jgi:hypothetical protein
MTMVGPMAELGMRKPPGCLCLAKTPPCEDADQTAVVKDWNLVPGSPGGDPRPTLCDGVK